MKRKANQRQSIEIASSILCEIIDPLIYEDKIDPKLVFDCLKSEGFRYVFDTDMLILMGHYDNDIEDFTDDARKRIQDRSRI